MGLTCCIPPSHGNRRESASRETSRAKPTLAAAKDSVKLYRFKFNVKASIEKTQQLESSNSSRSNTSPVVLYERATTSSSREKTSDSFAIFPMTKVRPNLYIGN